MAAVESQKPLRVLIAGGGVAALETALALHELVPGGTDVTILAPGSEFFYRPMSVREPFAFAAAEQYPLAALARDAGAELISDELARVDPAARTVHTSAGAALEYDELVLAVGAHVEPHYEHALTIDDRHLDATMHGLIQDIELGYLGSLAFVAPPRMAWPLPLYELALMTANRAADMQVSPSITIATPEDSPLAIFGLQASQGVAELLADAAIRVIGSAYVDIPRAGEIVISPGEERLRVDRVIALPELYGPSIEGIPAGENGFVRVDPHGRVYETEHIYAAGDLTDFAVKHGGIAAEQADAAAESIALIAGADIQPEPFVPIIRGMLLTGTEPRYLSANITGGHGASSTISDVPSWSPPRKIAARYLAAYLDSHPVL